MTDPPPPSDEGATTVRGEDEDPANVHLDLFVALSTAIALCVGGIWFLAASGLVGLSVVVGTSAFVGLASWLVVPRWRGRRRARAVLLWAREHGWQVAWLQAQTTDGATEVLHGVVDGVSVTSYAATFTPDWRRGLDTTRFRHVLTCTVDASFPALTIDPRRGARRPPAGPAEGDDVHVDSPLFDARWRVQCADARFAHDFCHPLIMERLMRPDVAGMSLLVAGGEIALHAPGATPLDAVESRAAALADLVHLIPSHLVVDHPVHRRTTRRERAATSVLRGAVPGETTGWPTVVMTTVVLGFVAGFVAIMVVAGAIEVALVIVGVVACASALPILSSSSVRNRRRNLL